MAKYTKNQLTRNQLLFSAALAVFAVLIALAVTTSLVSLIAIPLSVFALAFLSLKGLAYFSQIGKKQTKAPEEKREIIRQTTDLNSILKIFRKEKELEVTPQMYVAAHTTVKEQLKNESLTEIVMEYYLDRGAEPYATKLMAQELYKAKQAAKQEQTQYLETQQQTTNDQNNKAINPSR